MNYLIYPETRFLTDGSVINWAQDVFYSENPNWEADQPDWLSDIEECRAYLSDLGIATFARTPE